MGRGKIERVFETIQQQFPAEVTGDEQHPARHPVKDLEELDGLLGAWLRGVYHARIHSETGQAPQARHAAAGPPSASSSASPPWTTATPRPAARAAGPAARTRRSGGERRGTARRAARLPAI